MTQKKTLKRPAQIRVICDLDLTLIGLINKRSF